MRTVAVFLENLHEMCWGINSQLAYAFVNCFNQIGFKATLVVDANIIRSKHFDFVFSVAPSHESSYPKKPGTIYIMYQNEQLPCRDMTTHRANLVWRRCRQDILKYDVVFDVSKDNIEFLRMRGKKAFYFELGYHPLFNVKKQEVEKKYDVAFVGNIIGENSRREYILDGLRNFCETSGFSYNFCPTIVGDEYYQLMFSSKIFLNIHQTYIRFFESQKIVQTGFSNGVFLLSEPFARMERYKNDQHISVRPIAHFEQAIQHFLTHPKERECIASQGHQFVQKFLLVDSLRTTLDRAGITC